VSLACLDTTFPIQLALTVFHVQWAQASVFLGKQRVVFVRLENIKTQQDKISVNLVSLDSFNL